MPQLDKVTFLSQFFWLCLFFIGFYYLVLKYFLPKISRILTLRKKKMNLSQSYPLSLQQENQQLRQRLDNILSQGLSLSRNTFSDFLSRTNNWLDQSLTGVNKTDYKDVNKSYIQTVGETSLSQNIMLYYASNQSPENLKVRILVKNMKSLRNTLIFLLQSNRVQHDQNRSSLEVVKKKSKKNKKDTKI